MTVAGVLILQHDPNDGAAYLSEFLTHRGIPQLTLSLWTEASQAALPSSVQTILKAVRDTSSPFLFLPEGYRDTATTDAEVEVIQFEIRAVASVGGCMSANDNLPYYQAVFALLRSCTEACTPYMGHCLGGQLLAKALGGNVVPSPHPEVGWTVMHTTSSAVGPHAPLSPKQFFGDAVSFEAFQIHGEAFTLPPDCRLLVRGDVCPNQAFQYKDQYIIGTQFHPEVSAAKIRQLLSDPAPFLFHDKDVQQMSAEEREKKLGSSIVTIEAINASLEEGRVERNRFVADQLYTTWLESFQCYCKC